jgi:hypothetical protein
MATVTQDMKRFQLIDGCRDVIRRRGAHGFILLKLPATANSPQRRRISAKGPLGDTIAHTISGEKAFVVFSAAELLTSMEVIRRGYITG